jgi:peroxiredoxin
MTPTLVLCTLALSLGAPARLPAGEMGGTAADFSLKNLQGEVVSLSDVLGKGPVILNFWATWCKPCLKELPHIEKLQKDFREQGLTVLAISEDSPWSVSKVKSFVSGNRYTFHVLLDTNGKVMRKYGLLGTPYTFLLDAGGKILYKHFGYRPGDENALRAEVEKAFEAAQGGSGPVDEGEVGG